MQQPVTPPTVLGRMTFCVDTGEKPVTYPDDMLADGARMVGEYESREVEIRDGRPNRADFHLDVQGFELLDAPTVARDYYDDAAVRGTYYAECEALVRSRLGAEKVIIFDHTLRVEAIDKRTERNVRAPVHSLHNDYTEWSAPKRVRDLLPADEAEARLARRYQFINVWRPIVGPVHSWPLVLCDARTMAQKDMIAADHVYSAGRRGETYRVQYDPGQVWYWFSAMTTDEVVLIKCFDSLDDGRAKYSGHGAAQLATPAPAGSLPRESIEIRTIAFF